MDTVPAVSPRAPQRSVLGSGSAFDSMRRARSNPSTPRTVPLTGNKRPRPRPDSVPSAHREREIRRDDVKEEEEEDREEASKQGIQTWELRRIKYLPPAGSSGLDIDTRTSDLKTICDHVNQFASPHKASLGEGAPSLSQLCASQIRTYAQAGKLTYKTMPNEMVLCDAYLFQILSWPGLSARMLERLECKGERLGIIECLWAYYTNKQYHVEQLPSEFESWRALHEHKEQAKRKSLRESVQRLHLLNSNPNSLNISSSLRKGAAGGMVISKNGMNSNDGNGRNSAISNMRNMNDNRPRTMKRDNRIRYHRTSRFGSSSTSSSSAAFYNTSTHRVEESVIQRLRRNSKRRRR